MGLTVWIAACTDTTDPGDRAGTPLAPVAAADVIPAKGITPHSDAFIRSDHADKNYGTHDSLPIQKVGKSGATRILVAFPQSGIADSLGADSLVSASLELTIKRTGTDWGTTGRTVAVHRMTRAWTEGGVTWNCANDLNLGNKKADCTGNTWTMTGGTPPFDATAVAQSVITSGRSGLVSFDVTGDVRAFLANPTSNQGWLLKLAAEAQTGTVVFHSKETATKPRLALTIYRKTATPAEAPDLVPDWMYSDTNVAATGSASIAIPFTKRILVLQFKTGTMLAQREAAVAASGGSVVGGVRIAGGEGHYYLRIEDVEGETLLSKAAELRALPQVASAFVNVAGADQYRLPNDGPGWRGPGSWHILPTSFNPLFDTWAQTAINAPLAWGCTTGDPSMPIAVVDHDFGVGQNPNLFPDLQLMSRRTADRTGDGHGAAIAALLGARGNNDTAMTGMLWNADVRLYDYGVHQATVGAAAGAGFASPIAAEVEHAAEEEARVINVSLGIRYGGVNNPVGQGTLDQQRGRDEMAWALRGALQTMAARGHRPLVVLSAGNDGVDASWNGFPLVRDSFPTQVLVVGASTAQHTLWFNQPGAASNTGRYVDLVAPGKEVATYFRTGAILPQNGTSLSAALVSGIAGLLFSFDPRLTTEEVRRFIVDGAIRANRTITKDGHTYYLADAYEALKLAANRQGTPICGNRIWANAGNVYASRANGPEALFAPPAGERGAFALAPHHGGRQIDMLGWSSPNLAYTLSGTQWSESSEVPQIPDNQSGVSNSMWGLSHDGRQEAFIDMQAFNNDILRVLHADTTGTVTQLDLDIPLPHLPDWSDTACVWKQLSGPGLYVCAHLNAGTKDERWTSWAVAYSPTGDHAVAVVYTYRTTVTETGGAFSPCPWSVDDPNSGEPSDLCQPSFHTEKHAVKAELWDYPLPGGPARLLIELPNTVVEGIAISEDGTQLILSEGMKHENWDALPGGSPAGHEGFFITDNYQASTASCMITYRSFATGQVIEPSIPALYACELPVATAASVIAKAGQRARSMVPHKH